MNTKFNGLFFKALITFTILAFAGIAEAKENIGLGKKQPKTGQMKMGAGCSAATQQKDLDVNNVRTTILNGGDTWWNLSNARYEIPKVEPGQVSKNSLFSGALWIGGVTSGNLRIAAQTYRQNGNDYYPGPLQVDGSASITKERCKTYDKIWKVTLNEIDAFRTDFVSDANASDAITFWPGNPLPGDGSKGEGNYLAPFFDYNLNGIYETNDGDYPSFDQNVSNNIPDMMLYTIYNDKGNIHNESDGLPIGLELHTQSFGYSTNDEVNNMTFYRTTIYNRGSETIDSCIFGQWVDPDLGNYSDDYVECDVKRNLGICYNGDDNDEGILGYGLNPPSIGVNFFEGPQRIVNGDTSEIGLTKFIYYNNDFSVTGNPRRPEHYWNYLNGRWTDGLNITYGGNGRGGTDTASYMFPGKTDPGSRAEWSERTAGNTPGDRRFLQTAGSFNLTPGAVNQVTVAVVWARATTGGATGSFNLLKEASDKAFVLFKNNFKIVDGPGIPDLEIVELDHELIINITNYKKTESYIDSSAGLCNNKTIYKFQGYQIFQLKKNSIPSNLYNLDEAKLVAQSDIQDGASLLVNIVNDAELGSVKKIMVNGEDKGIKHSFKITKDYFSTFSDPTVVNFQSYYYLLVAYSSAINCSADAAQYLAGRKMANLDLNNTEQGIKIYTGVPHKSVPHSQGTVLNSTYNDGPEITKIEGIGNSGLALSLTKATIEKALIAPYYVPAPTYQMGKGPALVKVINPFKVPKTDFELRLVDYSKSALKDDSLTSDSSRWYLIDSSTPVVNGKLTPGRYYWLSSGSVKMKSNDPVFIGPGVFQADTNIVSGTFVILGEAMPSETTLAKPNEQVFSQWGLSITLLQVQKPGKADDANDDSNGFISASIEYADKTNAWLPGIPDELIPLVPFNWIRAGNSGTPDFKNQFENDFAETLGSGSKRAVDPRKQYNKILGGTWAPYALAARAISPSPTFGPAWAAGGNGGYSTDNPLSDLQSVEVVLTQDNTKWSRCVVLEAGENAATNIGGVEKLSRRKSPSVGKDGKPDGNGNGLGWFPGYALNVETGERLNIMFAEDSSIPTENGNDMIWNPTSNLIKGTPGGLDYLFGGKHHIYIMGSKAFKFVPTGPVKYQGPRYDECKSYDSLFNFVENGTSAIVHKRYVLSQALWVSMTLSSPKAKFGAPGDGLIPCDVRVKINVKRPYATFTKTSSSLENNGQPLYRFSTTALSEVIAGKESGKNALNLVSITPNPYYAYAGYEDPGNQLDSKVKIINLPTKCVVSIYTQGGFLVRRIKKDDNTKTYLDWNLKNDVNVPISSGVYLIHIYADGIGERIIKWFGIIRPSDFDTF
ncbi:MAG: hypothetical protein H7296_03590 [Bacteroidia bacterium]|nr:hypothetical protein [Bacteroidia bacterium]